MKRRLFVLPKAEADVDARFLYFREASVEVAHRFHTAALRTFQEMADNPGLGRERLLAGTPFRLRFWPIRGFEKHLVFYRDTGDAIEVVRVMHGARDIDSVIAGGA